MAEPWHRAVAHQRLASKLCDIGLVFHKPLHIFDHCFKVSPIFAWQEWVAPRSYLPPVGEVTWSDIDVSIRQSWVLSEDIACHQSGSLVIPQSQVERHGHHQLAAKHLRLKLQQRSNVSWRLNGWCPGDGFNLEPSLNCPGCCNHRQGEDQRRCVLRLFICRKTPIFPRPFIFGVHMSTCDFWQHIQLSQVTSNLLELTSGSLKDTCMVIQIVPCARIRYPTPNGVQPVQTVVWVFPEAASPLRCQPGLGRQPKVRHQVVSNSTPNAATKARSSVQVRWALANVTCSAFLTTSDTKALRASRSSSPEGRCLKSMMDIIWLSPTTGAARAPDRYAEGGREPLTTFEGAFAGLFSCSLGEIEGLALALGAACKAFSSASNRRAPSAKPARLPSRANCHALATARPASAKASSKLVNMKAKSVGVSTPWTAHQVSTFSASAAAIANDSSWDMAILAQSEPGTDSPKNLKIHGVYHTRLVSLWSWAKITKHFGLCTCWKQLHFTKPAEPWKWHKDLFNTTSWLAENSTKDPFPPIGRWSWLFTGRPARIRNTKDATFHQGKRTPWAKPNFNFKVIHLLGSFSNWNLFFGASIFSLASCSRSKPLVKNRTPDDPSIFIDGKDLTFPTMTRTSWNLAFAYPSLPNQLLPSPWAGHVFAPALFSTDWLWLLSFPSGPDKSWGTGKSCDSDPGHESLFNCTLKTIQNPTNISWGDRS